MTKKLISSLIAALFAPRPALPRAATIRCGSKARGRVGYINNDSNALTRRKLEQYQDLSNGVLSNIGVQGRSSKAWFQGYGENFGRTTSTCSCAAACTMSSRRGRT